MKFEGPEPRRPVDILLYIHSFVGGGAERITLQLANYWRQQGKSVVMVVNRDVGTLRPQLDLEVPVVILESAKAFLAFLPLGRLLRRLQPRISIAALTTCNISAGFARLWSRSSGKLLLVEHADLGLSLPAGPPLLRWFYRIAMPLAYRGASHLSGVSIDAARHSARVAKLPNSKVAVLHNPVWPNRTSDRPAAEVHRWLGGAEPVFVAAGRLMPQKNYFNLLEAFAEFRRRRPAKLIILGLGPLLELLRERARMLEIEGHVDFVGFRNDVADFLRWSNCFVLSSDHEALPLVLLEALQHPIGIVSTACSSGPGEILEDGRHGILVPVRDAHALADAMEAALTMPVDRIERDRVLAHYSIEAAASRYLAHLGEAGP